MRIAQIDFDGTLVRNNIGIELMKAYSKDLPTTLKHLKEREVFSPSQTELEEDIIEAWLLTNCSPQAEMIAASKRLAEHFSTMPITDFLAALEMKGYTPVIVSNGIETYIRAHIPFCYKIFATPAIWDAPNKCWHTSPNIDFKEDFTECMPVELHIGDSAETDLLSAAITTDKDFPAFAPYDSSLFKYKGILPIQGYSSFEDILAKL